MRFHACKKGGSGFAGFPSPADAGPPENSSRFGGLGGLPEERGGEGAVPQNSTLYR